MSDETNIDSQSNSDKRQFPRIQVETIVQYAVVIPVYESGSTKDIS